eukprot:TRINITY_DN34044_c0_g1_i1.p1 TRINITY_DN34044_c0_g1~~TRINITY_DN34044_c0_g1_i1.p1  ORF type:complete len:165 (+),score=2.44 TRINITY_DN34044_c0_g1_i1:29-496(+)
MSILVYCHISPCVTSSGRVQLHVPCPAHCCCVMRSSPRRLLRQGLKPNALSLLFCTLSSYPVLRLKFTSSLTFKERQHASRRGFVSRLGQILSAEARAWLKRERLGLSDILDHHKDDFVTISTGQKAAVMYLHSTPDRIFRYSDQMGSHVHQVSL